MVEECKLDEIGPWTEVKLKIVEEYARPYSLILTRRGEQYPEPFKHVYIDAFAGAGRHISRFKKQIVDGSPAVALSIDPPFKEYHFVDIDPDRVKELEKLVKQSTHQCYVYHGDCNKVLLERIFPKIEEERFGKGLCLLDPYGLHLNWGVVKAAGKTGKIEIFLSFPVMDMQRNVFRHDRNNVEETQLRRMNEFWGNERWQELVWGVSPQMDLFGEMKEEKLAKTTETVVAAYRLRLKENAGFEYVPEPIPMLNTKGGVVYYLFFASPKELGAKIAKDVLNKWRKKGLKSW